MTTKVTKFTDDYSTGRDIMVSSTTHIKDVINQQNKMYCNHAILKQCCCINMTTTNLILAFQHWLIFAIIDAGEEYIVASVTVFDYDCADSIIDEYFKEDPKATFKSTKFLVTIPLFIGKTVIKFSL